jgi:hypothetical protein
MSLACMHLFCDKKKHMGIAGDRGSDVSCPCLEYKQSLETKCSSTINVSASCDNAGSSSWYLAAI